MGRIDFNAAGAGALSLRQHSQNLSFGFHTSGVPGVVVPPAGGSFNPTAPGEYAFLLGVTDRAGVTTESAMLVEVVPEPGSMAQVGLALAGLAAASRRRA